MTESCTMVREREEGEAPSTVKQERKGRAESEAHRRGRGRRCLSVIPPRGERLEGSRVVADIAGDEEGGGGASGADERGTGQKRGTGCGRCLLWRPGGATERKGRGSGVPGSTLHGGREAGKREGAPSTAGVGGGIVARQRRATGHGRRWCERLTGGTGRQRGPVGSGWVWEGGGGSGVARRGALTGGPSSTVPAGRVLNPIQTESNYSKRFIRIQNCPNFGQLRKVPSHAPKIRNKIWLERA
jgi:hypothetical protein